jgi:ParB family transcriptional regulator, chromosome partitioning protein
MSKKLAAKASLIQLPPAPAAKAAVTEAAAPPAEHRPKTAPGTMAHFMVSHSAVAAEVDELRDKLRQFDGAVPIRALDARSIRPSKWANRHADSFTEAAFIELKAEIAAAGTNVQPIKVRPLPTPDAQARAYELVYGHRRHRACLELGLPVQAAVEAMGDQALFEAMERENRGRKNLSAWEQGMMYRRALEDGLYPSQRRLAEALGVDVALVSKSLALARLPQAVLDAFRSPLDVQYRWAQPLSEALQKDPDGLVTRARAVAAQRAELSPAQVLDRLVQAPAAKALNRSTPVARAEKIGHGHRTASLSVEPGGEVIVRFGRRTLDAARQQKLRDWLQEFLRAD